MSICGVLNGAFSLCISSLFLFSLSFQDSRTKSAQEERKKKKKKHGKNSLYLFSIFSLYHFKMRGPDRLRNFWFRQSLPKIKHNVVNTNPIIIIQKAKYTIKRKKKQKKTHKHKQIHNLSLKNILFQITKNPFKKKKK